MDQIWALLLHTLHEKISVVAVVIISMTNGCRGHCKVHRLITPEIWTYSISKKINTDQESSWDT